MLSLIFRSIQFINRIFGARNVPAYIPAKDTLETLKIVTFSDYERHLIEPLSYENFRDINGLESGLAKNFPLFSVHGHCAVCGKERHFYSSYKYAGFVNGVKKPNWREQLLCLHCALNNRQRAAYHLLQKVCEPGSDTNIYITEQKTAFYRMLKSVYKNTAGSEFLGDDCPRGEKNTKGLRNENLCDLSFADGQFDTILTYDVLEHVPDYKKALSECFRCLNQDGTLMITVPFNKNSRQNIVRAELMPDGTVNHILEPEYHGNPISNSGCLCYYHFSWQLLDELRECGFSDVYALLYWSQKYAYLGGEQLMIVARKSS